ncbi:MAG: YebC/PmpR family DNA-binding transcriptional regulator [Bacilli bacterium]|nr:YebC/PmpR family DNA-binding transcriptional regulator [Bacilli bacterium]
MSRKWNNIKYQKASKDANRSKILAKFGLEIYVAAKSEPDPSINRNLQMIIDKAKTYKVPRDIIDRAIEKAKGGKGEEYDNVVYEGYGTHGAAVIVECLTNNLNRTASEVRAAFTKNGGSLGVNGCVSYMFDTVAIIGATNLEEENVLDALIENDCDIQDIETTDEGVFVYADSKEFNNIQKVFQDLGVEDFLTCEITKVPSTYVSLDEESRKKFDRLIDMLEDLEDVQNVYHNVED